MDPIETQVDHISRAADAPPTDSTPDVPDWVADAVVYQIFPDRFASSGRAPSPGPLEAWDAPPTVHGFKGGDLFGIVEHLDYLTDLGVNALYLNPIFASASNHRYHTYDYFRVDPLLGGEEALAELLASAHARGIRVVIDGVFNHVGRGFWPFHHALENGSDSPYSDWFRIHDWPVNAYARRGKPNYEAWWGMRALPKLDLRHRPAREHVLRAAEHWTEFGVDGWRLDVPEEVDEPTFWPEFRRRVRAVRSDAYLVGEIWTAAPEWVRGDRFDGVMNYPLARSLIGFTARRLDRRAQPGGYTLESIDGEGMRDLLVDQSRAYPAAALHAHLNLLGSHDTERALTLVRGDHASVHLAAILLFALPGAPCVYYGDEIGLEGRADPGCRGAFPWDETAWHSETRELFRSAIRLRRDEPALRRGSCAILDARDRRMIFVRTLGDCHLVVAVEAGTRRRTRAAIPLEVAHGGRVDIDAKLSYGGAAASLDRSSSELRLVLPKRSALVVAVRGARPLRLSTNGDDSQA